VIRLLKIGLFLAGLVPLARLGWKAYAGLLGANPIEVITHSTGDWTLIFICITLAVTPIRMLTRQYWLARFRRMLGLFAFFYGVLHFTTYIWLDKFFDVHEMIKDVAKRPFITAGFTAFVLMIPLAITSTKGWIRRLGGRRWNWLHKLIYVSAIAGVVHYVWLVKADLTKPIRYAVVVGLLLSYRIIAWAIPRIKDQLAFRRRVPQASRTGSQSSRPDEALSSQSRFAEMFEENQ
jgi:sulfoxide reductase heme-binding subunit YedZ